MERGYYKRRALEFEHTRAISYWAIRPYMKQVLMMHEFWALPTDSQVDINEEQRLLNLMKSVHEKVAEKNEREKLKKQNG